MTPRGEKGATPCSRLDYLSFIVILGNRVLYYGFTGPKLFCNMIVDPYKVELVLF